jgi:uncharacterized tellurite resistance protein B-like protein
VRFLRLASLLFAFAAAASPQAFARAGGGHSYRSSSGGGYSSGGGGGGFSFGGGSSSSHWDDSPSYVSRRTVHTASSDDSELIWLMVVLFVLILYFWMNSNQQGLGAQMIAQATEHQDAARLRAQLEDLRARDPDFDSEALLERVKTGFLKIQSAWSAQNLAPVRPFITDGVFERFGLQIEMQKAKGIRNEARDVEVLSAEVLEVESDPGFDTIHVSIKARARDVDVSLKDGSLVRDGGTDGFEEVWSFLRRPGAKTLSKPGLLEGACPSCGNSLEAADAAKCPGCGTWIQSGEHDWLLAEITQAIEWAVREEFNLPGWAALAKRDAALAPQHLEDRASVAFWRREFALFKKEASAVKAIGAPSWIAQVAAQFGQPSLAEVAVGKVELAVVNSTGDKDQAHVVVKWSGLRPGTDDAVVQATVFTLERSSGAVTGAAGFRTLACAGCGASASARDAEKCEFCGLPFNDGSRYWIVASAVPFSEWKAPSASGEPQPRWSTSLSPHDAVAALVWAMMADGQVDPRELNFARSFADANGVSRTELGELVRSAQAGQLQLPQAKDPEQAEQVLVGLIRMSLADGSISPEEQDAIQAYAAQFGITQDDVRQMIQEQKAAMFEDAKEALHGPR